MLRNKNTYELFLIIKQTVWCRFGLTLVLRLVLTSLFVEEEFVGAFMLENNGRLSAKSAAKK